VSERSKNGRLAATAAGGLLLFNFPVLAIFDQGLVAGVPVLWSYLFLAWAALIGLVAWIVRS
jgi:hypothetical protein